MSDEKAKILIADDNEKNLRLLQMTLKREGYEMFVCKDGEDALKTFIQEKPDLVILDALMPKMDGFTVCKQMRGHKSEKYVPIIISSAFYKQETYKDECKKIGADEFIPKPIKPAHMLETVKKLLEKAKE